MMTARNFRGAVRSCETCGLKDLLRDLGLPTWRPIGFASNDNYIKKPPTIVLPTDEVSRKPHFVARLAILYSGLNIPRRRALDWIASVILEYPADIRNSDGSMYCRCSLDLDSEFRTDSDASYTWLRDFEEFSVIAPSQLAQKKNCPKNSGNLRGHCDKDALGDRAFN
jgi:hypothetical protein